MLMGDMWVTAMHEGMREVFVQARAWFELVEFVSGVRCGSEEGVKE